MKKRGRGVERLAGQITKLSPFKPNAGRAHLTDFVGQDLKEIRVDLDGDQLSYDAGEAQALIAGAGAKLEHAHIPRLIHPDKTGEVGDILVVVLVGVDQVIMLGKSA